MNAEIHDQAPPLTAEERGALYGEMAPFNQTTRTITQCVGQIEYDHFVSNYYFPKAREKKNSTFLDKLVESISFSV
tara:strand:- start:401 stop:628 length:228 start_codon:yes stop_codon:yes gene_type:complete